MAVVCLLLKLSTWGRSAGITGGGRGERVVMDFNFSLVATLPDFWTSGRWESFRGMTTPPAPTLSPHKQD